MSLKALQEKGGGRKGWKEEKDVIESTARQKEVEERNGNNLL